jgi:hypothetical protein
VCCFVAKQWVVRLLIAGFLIAVSSVGSAQNVNVQNFKAAPGPYDILNLRASRPSGTLGFYNALTLYYANDEVHWTDGNIYVRPITDRLGAELTSVLGLPRGFDIGLGLPVNLWQRNLDYPHLGDEDNRAGLGDLTLFGKYSIIDNRSSGFGLAAAVDLSFPTGRKDVWMRAAGVTFTPRVAADYRFSTGLLVTLNAGFAIRPSALIRGNDKVQNALVLGAGTEVPLGIFGLSVLGELNATLAMPVP